MSYQEALDAPAPAAASAPSAKVKKLHAKLFGNLLTLDELLQSLGGHYSRASIYTWISRERFPRRKIRGKLFFDPSDVQLWFERTGRR